MGIDFKGAQGDFQDGGDENILYWVVVVATHIYTFVELIKLYT